MFSSVPQIVFSFFPTSVNEETILSPLYILGTLVKVKLTAYA